jgi:hypothetical protein
MAIMMIMIAMLVMVMMVTMIVRCAIMRRVLVRIAFRRVRMAAPGIGSAFRIKRRFDLDYAGAEPFDHRFDDVIAPDTQALRRDLRRQMTVAEMPGDPNQMVRVGTPYLGQWLRRRHHLDQPVIVEHQRVATSQHCRVFQVEQKLKPAGARHRHPPPVTIVETENDSIGRRLRPAMLRADLCRADHLRMLIASRPCCHR